MRITKILLISLCCLVAALPVAWGQAANSQSHQSILGYLDPQTGAFRPVPPAAEETDFAASTVFTGTVTVTITITVKTTALSTFTCTATVSVPDGTTFWNESNTVSATGTGATRTCKLSIPYSWSLASQATDSMTTSYTVLGSGGTATALTQRTSTRTPLDVRKVPSSGTTTALTAAVTQ